MRRSSLLFLVLFAIASPVSAHVGNHTGDTWPLVASLNASQGWGSFKVHTDGGQIAVQLHSGGFTSPVTVGMAVYTEDDQFLQAVGFSAYYGRTGVRLEASGAPSIVQTVDEYSNPTMGIGMTGMITSPGPATYKILTWSAAKRLVSWDVRVRAENGTLLGRDEGSDAFLYTSDDFTGAAAANVDVVGAGARASVALNRAITVQDRIFGWYLQPIASGCCTALTAASPNANLLSVTTPTRERDCLLGCDLWRASENDGPGTYTFHVTGAGASPLSHGDDITLIGAVARLPV